LSELPDVLMKIVLAKAGAFNGYFSCQEKKKKKHNTCFSKYCEPGG